MAEKESSADLLDAELAHESNHNHGSKGSGSRRKAWIIGGIVGVIAAAAAALLIAHFAFGVFGSSSASSDVVQVSDVGTSGGTTVAPPESTAAVPPTGTSASTITYTPVVSERTASDIYGESILAGPTAAADFLANCQNVTDELSQTYAKIIEGEDKEATVEGFLYDWNDWNARVNIMFRLAYTFSLTHPDAGVREAASQCVGLVMAAISGSGSDPRVYAKAVAIQEKQIAGDKADRATTRVVELMIQMMEKDGTDLDQATRQKLSVLNGERTQLQQAFEVNIAKSVGSTVQVPLEEMNKCGFIMDFEADDKGMVTLNVDQMFGPVVSSCANSYVRRELYVAFMSRAHPDNEPVLRSFIQKCREMAALLGLEDWTQLVAQHMMTETDAGIRDFIDSIAGLLSPMAKAENEALAAAAVHLPDIESQIRAQADAYKAQMAALAEQATAAAGGSAASGGAADTGKPANGTQAGASTRSSLGDIIRVHYIDSQYLAGNQEVGGHTLPRRHAEVLPGTHSAAAAVEVYQPVSARAAARQHLRRRQAESKQNTTTTANSTAAAPADTATVEAYDAIFLSVILGTPDEPANETTSILAYLDFDVSLKGIMDFYGDMYELTFTEEPAPEEGKPTTVKGQWLQFVRRYAVRDAADGDKLVAHVNLDLLPREGKYTHNAMFPCRVAPATPDQVVEASLVMNLSPIPLPNNSTRRLMTQADLQTVLHEFGHVINQIFIGRGQPWQDLGMFDAQEGDFVEVASTVMEAWATKYEFLSRFARQIETGEPIPKWVVDFNNELAAASGPGVFTMDQVVRSDFSFSLYKEDPDKVSFEQLWSDLFNKYQSPQLMPDGAHVYASFNHITGYTSNYYTYLWAQVIAADLQTRWEKEGTMNPAVFKSFRDEILTPGGLRPAAESVEAFLGRPYTFDSYAAKIRQQEEAAGAGAASTQAQAAGG